MGLGALPVGEGVVADGVGVALPEGDPVTGPTRRGRAGRGALPAGAEAQGEPPGDADGGGAEGQAVDAGRQRLA